MTATAETTRVRATRWDVHVVVGALVVLALVGWVLAAQLADHDMTVGVLTDSGDEMSTDMMGMDSMGMNAMGMGFGLFITTWVVMMVAMMFPATAPVVLLFERWRRQRSRGPASTLAFVLGYLMVWSVAGLLAYGALMLVDDHVADTSWAVRLGGGVLVAAGLYQLTPLKTACLQRCRSPLGLVMVHARRLGRGLRGPFEVGVLHGAFCLGCCWMLMAVLLALGMMNLAWMAAVSALILVEKVLPRGDTVGRVLGAGLGVVGIVVLATGNALG